MDHSSAQNPSRVPRTADHQPPALTYVNSVLDELLPGIETTFKFDWNPVSFLEQQYGQVVDPPLVKVITWTEHDGNVEAQECAEYVEQQWPETGTKHLSALGRAVATRFEKEAAGENPLIFRLVEGRLQVTIDGLKPTTAEMVGLLCWLGAACRPSNAPDVRSYCTPVLRKMTKTKAQTVEVSYP